MELHKRLGLQKMFGFGDKIVIFWYWISNQHNDL